MVLASSRYRPGMLANTLQCTQGLIQSEVPRLQKPSSEQKQRSFDHTDSLNRRGRLPAGGGGAGHHAHRPQSARATTRRRPPRPPSPPDPHPTPRPLSFSHVLFSTQPERGTTPAPMQTTLESLTISQLWRGAPAPHLSSEPPSPLSQPQKAKKPAEKAWEHPAKSPVIATAQRLLGPAEVKSNKAKPVRKPVRAQGRQTLRRRRESGLCQTVRFQRRCGGVSEMVPSFN